VLLFLLFVNHANHIWKITKTTKFSKCEIRTVFPVWENKGADYHNHFYTVLKGTGCLLSCAK